MRELTFGLIGGTGLGDAIAAEWGAGAGGSATARRHEVDTPFGSPSGAIVELQFGRVRVLFLARHGAGHVIPPSQIPFRANIFALKKLGCTHILASGAVGSLREEFAPKDLVVCDQVIDKTTRRVGTFYDRAAVHVEFAEPFCPILRRLLLSAASSLTPDDVAQAELGLPTPPMVGKSKVHDGGCYVTMEGPAFGTRAESLMHRIWGGDLIGMTAMPEAKLAREAEIPYALLAMVTDYDAWRPRPVPTPPAGDVQHAAADPTLKAIESMQTQVVPDSHSLLAEIRENLHQATTAAVTLIRAAMEQADQHADALWKCPAIDSLENAIWSDRSRIDPVERERLSVLWGKYLVNK